MDDINIIDRFTQTFVDYIESGFGLLSGDVYFLTSILIGIDIALAGLFWAFDENRDVIAGLIKKVLYVGFFALILNNYETFTGIIFESFGGLGIRAVEGAPLREPENLLKPGTIAATGFEAAHPIMREIRTSLGDVGPLSGWGNTVVAAGLFLAWLLVLLAFFILAIQLFVTIIEFKLTTLAGYVLVPFALWNKSAFLAERVLGNIISSGIKLMVLAVVIGIGSTLFGTFTAGTGGEPVELENAMVMVLAALTLLGLAIFTPGIAAGLVSGAPQLGAGAAAGTVLAAGAAGYGAASLARAGAAAAWNTGRGAVRAASGAAGGAAAAYGLGQATSGTGGLRGAAAGIAGIAKAGASAARNAVTAPFGRAADGVRSSYAAGAHGAWTATGGASAGGGAASSGGSSAPQWAQRLRRDQQTREAAHVTAHTLREGDRPAAPANPTLKDED